MPAEGPDDRSRTGHGDAAPTGSEHLLAALRGAGIEVVIGLPGTQTLPVDRAVIDAPDLRYVMARHETAIPHVAWGYFEAGGTPAATVTVPGPGDTNAMHGLKNALDDNVPIVHVSADVDPADRGKGPIHEIDPHTYDTVVKSNEVITRPVELPAAIERGVEAAFTPPTGPVRLGIPAPYFDRPIDAPSIDGGTTTPATRPADRIGRAVELLEDAERPVIVVGGGCRRAGTGIAQLPSLVDALNAQVVATYKGKGVFPEDDPRFLGVTGGHLPEGARAVLDGSDVVLALGTDFDGVGTDHWSLSFGETLIHVTLELDDVDRGYAADLAILHDAGEVCAAVLDELPSTTAGWEGRTLGDPVRAEWHRHLADEGLFDDGPPLTSPQVLAVTRCELPRETTVATDIGGFRLWTLQAWEAYDPSTFITAGSWAGMGIGVPAVLGAELAEPAGPVVGLTGDGGLLMCLQELHTIAEEGLAPTLIVANNRDYGIITHAPNQAAPDFGWESPAFTEIAAGFGWQAHQVETAGELAAAVGWATASDQPTLIDARIDPTEPTVFECASYETTIAP